MVHIEFMQEMRKQTHLCMRVSVYTSLGYHCTLPVQQKPGNLKCKCLFDKSFLCLQVCVGESRTH